MLYTQGAANSNININITMRRVVILELKTIPPQIEVFRTCTDMIAKHKDSLGVCIGALWNALCKGGGYYENKKCKVYYKYIEGKCKPAAPSAKE